MRFEVLTALLLKIQVFYDTMLWITKPSSLWPSIPRKAVLATLMGMIDTEHEGTTMLLNTGKFLQIYRCENPEDLNLDQYCCH